MAIHARARASREPSSARACAAMALAAVAMLGACASKPTVVVPPTPIRLLAVLPVAPLAEGASVGFGGQRPGTVVVPVAAPSAGAAAAAIGVGIVVAAVVQSARDEKHRERLALKEAMDVLSFDIAAQADQHLAAALQQHPGVVVVFVRDPALAAAVRAGRFDGLPAGVDAYLDISVDEAGFEKSRRAGGYAPVVNLGLTIRPLNEQGDDLASFVYYADTRDGGRNKRWWTTPPSMTFKTLDALKADAPAVRAGLDALLQQMSVSMARDISRRAAGEAVAND